jgi:hypothetical protein
MVRVNPKWLETVITGYRETDMIDVTETYLPAVKELVRWLSNRGIDFRVYNVGAGVRRVTTETDICPCCKRKL